MTDRDEMLSLIKRLANALAVEVAACAERNPKAGHHEIAYSLIDEASGLVALDE